MNMVEQAKLYAAADSSDPFAFRRAITHLRNGIASFVNKDGDAAYYSAEKHYEPRSMTLPNGEVMEWQAEVYRNRFRP